MFADNKYSTPAFECFLYPEATISLTIVTIKMFYYIILSALGIKLLFKI